MNKDQTSGRVETAKGTVKEVAGKVLGNKEMESKGKVQKNAGKVESSYGDAKENVKDAAKALRGK